MHEFPYGHPAHLPFAFPGGQTPARLRPPLCQAGTGTSAIRCFSSLWCLLPSSEEQGERITQKKA
jgi:hypothetical protein